MAAASVNLGYLMYQRGQHQEALDHFEQARTRFPKYAPLFLNYGYLLYLEYENGEKNTLPGATAATRQATVLDPQSFEAADNLAFFLYEQDDFDAAVESWRKANSLNPDEPDISAGLGLGLFKLGQTEQALKYYKAAVMHDNGYRDPRKLRARYHWSKKAAADAELLIELLAANQEQ